MKNEKSTFGLLLSSFYSKNKVRFILTLLLSLLTVPLELMLAWVLGSVIDAVTVGDTSFLAFTSIAALVLCLFFLLHSTVLAHVNAKFVHRAMAQYKSAAFGKIARKSISAFSHENSGRYISVLTSDASEIEAKYLSRSFDIIANAFLVLGALGMMLFYSPILTAAAIALGTLPMLVSLTSRKTLSKAEINVSGKNEGFVAMIKDTLSGFAVIKSFKAEKEVLQRFDVANNEIECVKRKKRFLADTIGAISNFCGVSMQLGLFIISAYLSTRGLISAGSVIMFVQLIGYLESGIYNLPRWYGERVAAKKLIEKLAALCDENASHGGDSIKAELKDGIELKDVSFGYDGGENVLDKISLKFAKGGKYAIVGPSGSGKSTLINLLMGAYGDYSGSIAVDGKELREINTDSLYELESLIGQSVFLFDDTIENNISMFRSFDRERLEEAESRSGLSELIAEKGRDCMCGENGCNLSGGERQRVSIARSLLRGTPVLMLDEATAALDNQTSVAVINAILSLEGLTRIVVTHRLEQTLLKQYDAIFVLNGGRVRECGSFDELMNKKGLFYSMYTVASD